jgi:hypothetical protein
MKVTLTPSFELTDEHSFSSYGQAVLVNRATQEGYGPGDIIRPYPSWDFQPAGEAVKRMAKSGKFTHNERKFVDDFIDFGK